jgi:hypothetical protein
MKRLMMEMTGVLEMIVIKASCRQIYKSSFTHMLDESDQRLSGIEVDRIGSCLPGG